MINFFLVIYKTLSRSEEYFVPYNSVFNLFLGIIFFHQWSIPTSSPYVNLIVKLLHFMSIRSRVHGIRFVKSLGKRAQQLNQTTFISLPVRCQTTTTTERARGGARATSTPCWCCCWLCGGRRRFTTARRSGWRTSASPTTTRRTRRLRDSVR